jgi:hypothetical protein
MDINLVSLKRGVTRRMNSATLSRLALLRSDGVVTDRASACASVNVVLNANQFTLFATLYQHSLTLRN